MSFAFLTGALAAGFAGAILAAAVLWVVGVATGMPAPWPVAPLLIGVAAAAFAAATFVAERLVYRREQERKRSHGEPWAYRRD